MSVESHKMNGEIESSGGGGITIGDIEHLSIIAGGAGLVAYGLSRKSIGGYVLTGLGCAMVARGVQGYKRVFDLLGIQNRQPSKLDRSMQADARVYIDRPPEEVYQFWRTLENLPRFMPHLISVRERAGGLSRWVAKGPLGIAVEWQARITRDVENEMIGWQSVEGSDVDNAGSVRFLPSGRGTEVRVAMRYNPPGDMVGAYAAKLMHAGPETKIEQDLERLKQILESDASEIQQKEH